LIYFNIIINCYIPVQERGFVVRVIGQALQRVVGQDCAKGSMGFEVGRRRFINK
jgi:hypothetical protein